MTISIEDILSADYLPSLPEVAYRVLTLAQDSNSDVEMLAEAVKADPAISAKILRTANSAHFGRQFTVSSVQAAIPVLGETLLRTLVLGFSLPKRDKWQHLEPAYRLVWRRAVVQAVAAEQLAETDPNADAALYFLCGLVQDIGSLAILSAHGNAYAENVISTKKSANQIGKEHKLYGYNHVDVSVGLCAKWQLDDDALKAIKQHHEPPNLLRYGKTQRGSTLTEALKVASLCAHYVETDSQRYSQAFTASMSRTFGIGGAEMDNFFSRLQTRVTDSESVYNQGIEQLPTMDDIMRQAQTAIEDVAIQGQLRATCRRRLLEKEVSEDPLTGACNRRGLESRMAEMIQLCIEGEQPLGVLFFDLDNFKPHNDELGHEAGDNALKVFVNVLRNSIRSEDLVVRYGGDEFVAVCMGPSFDELKSISRRVRERFEAQFHGLTDETSLTASVGGIYCSHEELPGIEIATALQEADKRMYESKRRGKNQSTVSVHSNSCWGQSSFLSMTKKAFSTQKSN